MMSNINFEELYASIVNEATKNGGMSLIILILLIILVIVTLYLLLNNKEVNKK